MSEFAISYRTKIVDITDVTMAGVLTVKDTHDDPEFSDYNYHVGDRDLEAMLDKFTGKYVRVTITLLDGQDDDTKLLPYAKEVG